eukprot:6194324-Pleurochrysis_carterae.AAC.2
MSHGPTNVLATHVGHHRLRVPTTCVIERRANAPVVSCKRARRRRAVLPADLGRACPPLFMAGTPITIASTDLFHMWNQLVATTPRTQLVAPFDLNDGA